jgi:hypothetical protein
MLSFFAGELVLVGRLGVFCDALSSFCKCSMRDVVSLLKIFSLFDDLAVEGVARFSFAPALFANASDPGVAATLVFAPRLVVAGVAVNEARDGFLRLPGFAGLTAAFGAGV